MKSTEAISLALYPLLVAVALFAAASEAAGFFPAIAVLGLYGAAIGVCLRGRNPPPWSSLKLVIAAAALLSALMLALYESSAALSVALVVFFFVWLRWLNEARNDRQAT